MSLPCGSFLWKPCPPAEWQLIFRQEHGSVLMTPALMFTSSGPRGHMLCSGFAYCTKCSCVHFHCWPLEGTSTPLLQNLVQWLQHIEDIWKNVVPQIPSVNPLPLSTSFIWPHSWFLLNLSVLCQKARGRNNDIIGTLTQKLHPYHMMKYLSENITQLPFTSRIPLLLSSWDDITSCQSKIATQLFFSPPPSFPPRFNSLILWQA